MEPRASSSTVLTRDHPSFGIHYKGPHPLVATESRPEQVVFYASARGPRTETAVKADRKDLTASLALSP